MKCNRCGAESAVIHERGARRIRECPAGHRWYTELTERRLSEESEPAKPETVWAMSAAGASTRKIAKALLISTATVQQHLRAAPTLEHAWLRSREPGREVVAL